MPKRIFYKILPIFIAFTLIFSLLGPTNSGVAKKVESDSNGLTEEPVFKDVGGYEKEIYQLVNLGIIQGYPDKTFKPYNFITRAQGVAMIIREMDLDTNNRQNPNFKDIDSNYRFYDVIATAVEEGIIDGFIDDTFRPEAEMTRAQMAKILVNAYDLKLKKLESKNFDDVPATYWAYEYINILASNGITIGYEDGTFKPTGNLTRLDFSLFLYRYIDQVKSEQNREVEELKKRFTLKADKSEVSYGESASLNLQVNNKEDLNYKTSWKASGGKLTVDKDGNSANWTAEQNSTKDYVVTVSVETTTKSGEKVNFDKNITISTVSTGGSSGGGSGSGSSGGSPKELSIEIKSPTVESEYNATTSKVTIQGTASAPKKIKEVVYSVYYNDSLEVSSNGKAEGTKNWKVESLELKPGTTYYCCGSCRFFR